MSIADANELFARGRYPEAISEYQKLNPKNPLYKQAQFNSKIAKKKMQLNNCSFNSNTDNMKSFSLSDRFSSLFNLPSKTGWTAIITLWKRADYLEEQLRAVFEQSFSPDKVILIQNESHFNVPEKIITTENIVHIQSGLNSLYTRWIIGYLVDTKYVCIFDDDVIPGKDWISTCIKTSLKYNALVGPSGRLAKPENTPAWESVEAYSGNNDLICDWVCNSYFFQTAWVKYIVQADRYGLYHKTFDDIQLATTLKAMGNIKSVVPLQENQSKNGHLKREYGHDDHALWKRQPSDHMLKRSEFIRNLTNVGFKWCDEQ